MFEFLNATTKGRIPKITDADDFMGNDHSGEMTTTSATMVGIKHFFIFNMGETTTKDNYDTSTINIVTDEDVPRGLISNTSSIITSDMGGKFLGLQISKDVAIPRNI